MDKKKQTVYARYGVVNVSKSEEFAHICRPDKYSPVYHEFIEHINYTVGKLGKLLSDNNIAYSANEFIDGHLYRIYIPCKDLLIDFEYYPVVNFRYNYMRINYNDDIEIIFMQLFPKEIISTEDAEVWVLTQRANNRFLKENKSSPIYDKSVLRLALVKDREIYQSITLKYDEVKQYNKIISNVSKLNSQVDYGTVILLRYFKEIYDCEDIHINSSCDNSYRETTYQLMNMKLVDQQCKKKIWWSPKGCNWHVKKEHIDEYVPFYFTEKRTWIF